MYVDSDNGGNKVVFKHIILTMLTYHVFRLKKTQRMKINSTSNIYKTYSNIPVATYQRMIPWDYCFLRAISLFLLIDTKDQMSHDLFFDVIRDLFFWYKPAAQSSFVHFPLSFVLSSYAIDLQSLRAKKVLFL